MKFKLLLVIAILEIVGKFRRALLARRKSFTNTGGYVPRTGNRCAYGAWASLLHYGDASQTIRRAVKIE
jgi:hypothetical protein